MEDMTKSATRKELADAAGVSVNTFKRWLNLIMPELIKLGYKKGNKILSPPITEFICKHFSIELYEKPPPFRDQMRPNETKCDQMRPDATK